MKIHSSDEKKMLSACDTDILGKSFEQDSSVLDISESFFRGETASFESITDAINLCDSCHIVGNNLTRKLIDSGMIKAENVKDIDGNRHIMIFRL